MFRSNRGHGSRKERATMKKYMHALAGAVFSAIVIVSAAFAADDSMMGAIPLPDAIESKGAAMDDSGPAIVPPTTADSMALPPADPLAWDPVATTPAPAPAASATGLPADPLSAAPPAALPPAEAPASPVMPAPAAPVAAAPAAGLDAIESRLSALEDRLDSIEQKQVSKSDIDALRASVKELQSAPAAKQERPKAEKAAQPAAKKKKSVKKAAPAPSKKWVLKSAKPGMAWLVEMNGVGGEMRTVTVGDLVPGLGRITAVSAGDDGRWVVVGTQGKVSQ
jgi:hypothetical protein